MTEPASHKDQVLNQFTQQAESYARLTAGLASRGQSDDLAALGAQPDDVVLDVACGSGNLAVPLAARVKHVTAIDLTPAMIEQGRARQADKGLTNIDWIVGDVDPLPFGDALFSLVTCSAAIHHFDRPARVVREMVRVCTPGGRIAVRDFAYPPDKVAAFDAMEQRRDPSHVHAHTLEELRALADGLDISELVVEPYPAGPLPLEAILATSFPTECSLDSIRAIFREDTDSGEDRLGLQTHARDGALYVTYPMVTIVWSRRN